MQASLKIVVLTESKKTAEKYTPSIPSSRRHSYDVCRQGQEKDDEFSLSMLCMTVNMFSTEELRKLCQIVIDVQQFVLFSLYGKNIM